MRERPRVIALTEYVPLELEQDGLPDEVAGLLLQEHSVQVALEPPWAKTGYRWRLTSQGWIGHLPVTHDLHLALHPRVPIDNVFAMLEYAYKVGHFLPDGMVGVESLQELYERLALVLAKRVLDRGRHGFHRAYVSLEDQTSFVRGRMDLRWVARAPWETRIHCLYQEHTADIEDNQILGWALFSAARSGLCTERTLPTVRQAFRQVRQCVSLEHKTAACCLGRVYHRLNQDYAPLHALCRFFLESTGPSHLAGEQGMLPFLIDMAVLFETFVAEWLRAHQSAEWAIRPHYRFTWDAQHGLHSDVDLVLAERSTGRPFAVLDTKYKMGDGPNESDIHQVVFYAQALNCQEAILIYPRPVARPVDASVQDIRVRTLGFPLAGDLDAAGAALMEALADLVTAE